jgi:hypothetical protein
VLVKDETPESRMTDRDDAEEIVDLALEPARRK